MPSPWPKLRRSDVTRGLLATEQAGKSASTRRNPYAALRAALDDAVANGRLAVNPAVRVERPSADHTGALSLTPTQVAQLLDGAHGLRYRDVLRLILGTGVRRGKALALTWPEVDLDRSEGEIVGSLVRSHGRLVISRPKTKHSRRVVARSPAVVALLRAHRATQAAERLRAANYWADTGFVFTTELGEPADPRNLMRTVKLASGKGGLPLMGVHTLRHVHATTALLAGVSAARRLSELGPLLDRDHRDIYGLVTDDAARAAANAVSDALQL